jgi:hypothetical protein
VIAVRSLTSEIKVEAEKHWDLVSTGWQAKLIGCVRDWRLPVGILPETGMAEDSRFTNNEYLKIGLKGDGQFAATMFNIVVHNGQYEVRYGNRDRVPTIPSVPMGAPQAGDKVLRIPKHLWMFKYLESIDNNDAAFEKKFTITATLVDTDDDGLNVLNLSPDSKWTITLQSNAEEPLHYTIFQFSASWKVNNLFATSRHGKLHVLAPHRRKKWQGTLGCLD